MPRRYRILPNFLQQRVGTFGTQDYFAGIVLGLNERLIADYPFLNGRFDVMSEERQVIRIPETQGFTSKRNSNGWVVTRYDLPKVVRNIDYGERDIYGDPARGSFRLIVRREVYQKSVYDAPNLSIEAYYLGEGNAIGEKANLYLFRLNRTLRNGQENFPNEHLFHLNLIQECFKKSSFYRVDATNPELRAEVQLPWQIFPPDIAGDRTILDIFLNRFNVGDNEQDKEEATRRYDFLASLSTGPFVVGFDGFHGYVGKVIREDLAVFDKLANGNALYILKEEWQPLTHLTRSQLQQLPENQCVRVIHDTAAARSHENRVRVVVNNYLNRTAGL